MIRRFFCTFVCLKGSWSLRLRLVLRLISYRMPQLVQVIVPVPVPRMFTYSVPERWEGKVGEGYRVIVPFGSRNLYTGIVFDAAAAHPGGTLKDVDTVLDDYPVMTPRQLKLLTWITEYYMCSVGEVMRAALPAGLKVETETVVEVNPDFDPTIPPGLDDERQLMLWQTLSLKGKMSSKNLAKTTGIERTETLVDAMLEKGAVIVSERLVERFRPRKQYLIAPVMDLAADRRAEVHRLYDVVGRAPVQQRILTALLQLTGALSGKEVKPVLRARLLEAAEVSTPATLTALESKGVIHTEIVETSRFDAETTPAAIEAEAVLPVLSEQQDEALREVRSSFAQKEVVLLHGVTSSGKTEIYIHLIDETLKSGRQVLMLVPEIALTTQLTRRLQRVFGDRVIIYHSKFSDGKRVEVWKDLLNKREPCVVIGARSAVLLPMYDLGLVIVDEEHEPSYKQFDPAPRYNARDVATVVARMHKAKTLLGSATPTIETYYKAMQGRFGLVSLTTRYKGVRLPRISVTDMTRARLKGEVHGALADSTAMELAQTVSAGNQAIIFHNRRGFAPIARCKQCAYIPKCPNCDVSMTYHRRQGELVCHYCGHTMPLPKICPECGLPAIEVLGYGTERVEDDIAERLPKARMLRMDLDTTRNKDDYANIIDDFSQHKADILVGTQMVTKGLDFSDVSTAVVLNADTIINFPDFRSAERAFNMLEQVSGRAGRRETPGHVIIQTANPGHPIVDYVCRHDYQGYYKHELGERETFGYPPFSHIIYIYFKHRDSERVAKASETFATMMRQTFGTGVYGPDSPEIGRIQQMYIRRIMLKFQPDISPTQVKRAINQICLNFHIVSPCSGLMIYYDVDPM